MDGTEHDFGASEYGWIPQRLEDRPVDSQVARERTHLDLAGSERASCQKEAQRLERILRPKSAGFRTSTAEENLGIQDVYAALARDEARNQLILNDVIGSLEEGRSPVLTLAE